MIFWILTTPRSGSNFFAGEIWRQLGGRPKSMEFLSESLLRRQTGFVPDTDAPFGSYLDHLMSNESMDGLLAVKLMWGQVETCCKYPDFLPRIQAGKFIFLRRRDTIRQGISFYLAAQTGSWVSSAKSQPVSPEDVPYDYELIARNVARLDSDNAKIERFLSIFGLNAVSAWYEDFLRSPDSESDRIISFLGLSRVSQDEMSTRKVFEAQSTAVNDRFYDRFLADNRARLCGDGSYRGKPLF